jgi:spore maturation protein CgeB
MSIKTKPFNIAFFGSSLVSSYWNGAATYYRGIIRAFHELGHQTTFYEPDAYERQQHRDMADPEWSRVVVYPVTEEAVSACLEQARQADIVIKASGVGVFDALLEKEVLKLRHPSRLVVFWDVDAPATLDRVMQDPSDPFRAHIPYYDVILTYGGGPPVISAYTSLGAADCIPIYNGLDTSTHFPVLPEGKYICDLSFLGNRLPDRETRVDEFFFSVAASLPEHKFILGGSGWHNKSMSSNIHYTGHVYTLEHNLLSCSSKAILNISRESMARYGYSPATRVFEAAGAGACIITDEWEGIDYFFEPEKEILIARNGQEVKKILSGLNASKARDVGEAAYRKAIQKHTYTQRVSKLDSIFRELYKKAEAAYS